MSKMFGFLAVAGLLLVGAPMDRAQALSLSNPVGAGTAKYVSEGFTTEVRGGRGGGHRGGGGPHFGGGGRHFGGGFRGGGRHYGFRHRYYGPRYYYAPRHRCRIVLTHYGPRRICRPWRYW